MTEISTGVKNEDLRGRLKKKEWLVCLRLSDYCQDRKNNCDFIRFVAASLVIFSHSYALTNRSQDVLSVFTGGVMNLGTVGVYIFFLISGFFITKSFEEKPRVSLFLWARALRILPGLILVVLATAFVLGPMVTVLPMQQYFQHPAVYAYLKNILLYSTWHILPGAFEQLPYPQAVNGSLWTLTYEVRCYLAVALLGIMGIFHNKKLSLFLYSVFLAVIDLRYPGINFAAFFFMGSLIYMFRAWVILCKAFMIISVLLLIISFSWRIGMIYALLIYGSYLIFFMAFHPKIDLNSFGKYGDFSYGMYIYAFPVQQLFVYTSLANGYSLVPLKTFAVSFMITLCMAVFSWHFIEKKAFALKKFLY